MPNIRTFDSLKNPVYRLYYGGILGQMAAMNMQMVARSYLTYDITASAAILGALALAHAVPMTLLSLFGGVIADRMPKKYVLLIGLVGSTIVALGMALSLTFDYLSAERVSSWWILVASSVLQGVVMALMMPSRQAILPEIVGEEQLMNAVSLSTMGMSALRLFAPGIAGFLIDAYGFAAVYYTVAGAYVLSIVFITFLPRTSKITVRSRDAVDNIKEGFKYLRGQTSIMIILVIMLVTTVLAMPFQQLMPIFTEDILDVGASGLGILMSVSGAGAILVSLVLASLPNKRRGLMMLCGGIILGFALIGFSFSSSWPLSLSLIVIVGMGQNGQMALSNTLIQYYVQPEYRGRVMSILMMQFGLMSFSTFVAGALAEAVGIQWAVGGFAIGLAVMSIMALLFLHRVRNLD